MVLQALVVGLIALAGPASAATAAIKISAMARHYTSLAEASEIRVTPFGKPTSIAARLNMDLRGGDLVESTAKDIRVELTCPGRSPALLSDRFRVVILPEMAKCNLDLKAGNLDFMSREPTGVVSAGVVAGSRTTLYAVRAPGATESFPRVLVFEGEVAVTAGESTRTLRAGQKVQYAKGSLSETGAITEEERRLSAEVHAAVETSKVDPAMWNLQDVYRTLFGLLLKALAEPSNSQLWGELADIQVQLGLQTEASYSRHRALPASGLPEPTKESERKTARPSPPLVTITHLLRKVAGTWAASESSQDLLYTPAAQGQERTLASLGMQLGSGDLLESSTRDVVVEVACPRGSLARLYDGFRVRIEPAREGCGFDLLLGAIEVMAMEPTVVDHGDVRAASKNGLYAISDARNPGVRALDGELEVRSFGRFLEPPLPAGKELASRDHVVRIGASALLESADLQADVESVKAHLNDSAMARKELSELHLAALRNPNSQLSHALLGAVQAAAGLRRDAIFNLRRAAAFDPLLDLAGRLDLNSAWTTEDGEWNSLGCYALARALGEIEALARVSYKRFPVSKDAEKGMQQAAETALALDQKDHLLSSEQRGDCQQLRYGMPAHGDSVKYCGRAQAANLEWKVRRALVGNLGAWPARALALEALRLNERDRHLQTKEYRACAVIAGILPGDNATIDSAFLCQHAVAAWRNGSAEEAEAYAKLALNANRSDFKVLGTADCEALAWGTSP
jgi:hypothetical protein